LGWVNFFSGSHSLYVNEQHFRAHHEMVSQGIIANLPTEKGVVIDYGCGDTINAECVAAHCHTLILVEVSDNLRQRLIERYGNHPVIKIMSPDECWALNPQSVDVVIIHSVLQYLRWEETGQLIGQLRSLIKPQGSILLGDIIPPDRTIVQDIASLLTFAWSKRFFIASLYGLVTTFFSKYRSLRKQYGLTRYSAGDIHQMARKNGLFTRALKRNIGHDQTRNIYQLRLQ
jgi:2-polyprenyl-3-methyl-5-hydroxy-6-metoxy-1,4-benzoquinol methylase